MSIYKKDESSEVGGKAAGRCDSQGVEGGDSKTSPILKINWTTVPPIFDTRHWTNHHSADGEGQ